MNEPRAVLPDMTAYGVDAASWSPLPWSWALERLLPNRNFWLVTVSAEGRPHALPVWGVWDADESRFCCSCAPTARKARNLAANPSVVVMIDDTVECLSIEGRAELVTDPDRLATWTRRYLDRYRADAPELSAEFLAENLLWEVTPTWAFAVIEREAEFATRATKWVFDAVDAVDAVDG